MRKMINISVLFSLLSLFACEKDEPGDNNSSDTIPKETVNLDVVWKSVVYNDTTGANYLSPKFAGDYVVYCAESTWEDNDGLPGFVVYNKQTGERHPGWNHEPEFDGDYSIKDFEVGGDNQNVLFASTSYKLYAWDLNTGNELWTIDADHYFETKASSFGNYFFVTSTPKGNNIWSELQAINVQTGTVRSILKENWVDNYEFRFMPPVVKILDNNDTLLIFQKRGYNFNILDGKVDIYAYNLTADSIVWKVDDLTQSGNSSVMEGIITGNRYLFQGSNSIHCLDVQTGDILWEDRLPGESFFQQHNLYAYGKVFMNSETGNVFCYDVNTGTQLWANKKIFAYPSRGGTMAYYNYRLYLTSIPSYSVPESKRQPLKCFDAYTGEVYWSTNGPAPGSFTEGLIVDPANGYLYAENVFFGLCIDLNKNPLYKSK